MKSIIKYLTEGVGVIVPAKLPHQQTQDRIEDEKLSQMTSKERLNYLTKKEKEQKTKLIKGALIGVPTFIGGMAGATMLTKHLLDKYDPDKK